MQPLWVRVTWPDPWFVVVGILGRRIRCAMAPDPMGGNPTPPLKRVGVYLPL